MTVIHLRPVGWGSMTPKQWGTVRAMIRAVGSYADSVGDFSLMLRAQSFLIKTEGSDV